MQTNSSTGETESRSVPLTLSQFDASGKGYLDDTEKALRQLDSGNEAPFDLEQVYLVKGSLQDEQKWPAGLIKAVQTEHAHSVNLKMGIIALSVFAVLLVLSYTGTSFVAAWLAKDKQLQSGSSDMAALSGEHVPTANKVTEITMQPLPNGTRTQPGAESLLCGNTTQDAGDNNTAVFCQVQGQISNEAAEKLYQLFCPQWRPGGLWSGQCSDGVSEVMLGCNNKFSKIMGGPYLPSSPPFEGDGFVVFPSGTSRGEAYVAIQSVAAPPTTQQPGTPPCEQVFSLSMWCPDREYARENSWSSDCYVFSAYEPGTCLGEVHVCGDDTPSSR